MAKTVIPDTNVFMQCLLLDQVDWTLLNLGDEIVVLIPLTVHKEINKFKTDSGNPRRARRARLLSAWLAKASETPPFLIREANPRVTIAANPYPWKALPGSGLDLKDPDQEIVGYAAARFSEDPGVALLTGDSGLIGIARAEGIPVCRTPDEWLLLPEPDPKDKLIQEQKARLAEFEQAFPKVSCQVLDRAGADVRRITIDVPQYAPLSALDIQQLAQQAYRLRPYTNLGAEAVMQRQIGDYISRLGGAAGQRIPPGPEEFADYQARYQRWSSMLPKALGEAHLALSRRESVMRIVLRLENSGFAPATNVRLELMTDPDQVLLSFVEPDARKPIYPVPPRHPQARTEAELAADVAASGFFNKKPAANAEPRRFQWAAKPDAGGRLEASCQEWYHQLEPVELVIYVHAAHLGPEAIKAPVQIRLSAFNLPRPVEVVLPVQISFASPVSVRALAEQTLLEELQRAK